MNREALIEAMARAIDPAAWNTRIIESIPDYRSRQECSKVRAASALSAIEAMGTTVVPVEATYEMMLRGGIEHRDNPMSSIPSIHAAMIAASPYRKKAAED
jgi:hypothetical protein